jgi:hypothetical protein
MSDNKPDLTFDKVKILSSTPGTYEWKGATRPCLELVVQDQKDATKFVTGQFNIKEGQEADAEKLKKDAIVGPCWVYERKVGGETKASLFFPKEKGSGGGGGFKGGGGYSKPQDDPYLKIVSFAYAYAKDIYLATSTEKLNEEEYKDYKALKG